MTQEEAKKRLEAHIKEKGSIRGFGKSLCNKDVMEFLDKLYPDAKSVGEKFYALLHGRKLCDKCKTRYSGFINFTKGYYRHCCECCYEASGDAQRKESFEVHVICEQCGKEFVYMSKNEKEKIKPKKRFCSGSCASTHMHESMSEEDKKARLEKINKTNLERYGDKWVVNSRYTREKTKEKLGVEYAWQDKEILKKTNEWLNDESKIRKAAEKGKQTRLERYGDVMTATSCYKDYTFPSGKVVQCQGYEPSAIDKLLESHDENDIFVGRKEIHEQIGKITYIGTDGYEHEYFPDIYIKSENTIVEVKCKFTYDCHYTVNMLKKEACEKLGYKFIFMVIDKRKNTFELL